MATKKNVKKTNSKKTKNNHKQQRIKESRVSNRVKAIILLALAILMLAIMIVPGENVWKAVHEFMYGVFGICGFAVVVLLAALAHRYERGNEKRRSSARLWCVGFAIVFLEGLMHVIYAMATNVQSFNDGIKIAYEGWL
ncbi:MAG: hypothetical protein IKY44_06735, partial [Clostridia bacterium]|nr:hypothetical protein [Clostridia bacterium]